MISDYTSLQTDLLSWMERDDMTAQVSLFIRLGERRIYREIRIDSMESALSVTLAAGVATIPADYLELKQAYIDGNPVQPLQVKTSEFIFNTYPNRTADSKPSYIATDAGSFIFGPYPDSDYVLKGTYYKRLTVLSSTNTTNYFTGDGGDLLFWASLAEAETFLKNDERINLWEARYQMAKKEIMKERRRGRLSGILRSTPR